MRPAGNVLMGLGDKGGLAVLLATHNGAGVLPRVLEGYAQLEQPSSDWRLVVVNNASTDATDAVLAQFGGRLPLTILQEPTPGKNRALNRGLDHLRLEFGLLVLTDDDAVPDPDFLVQWEAVLSNDTKADLFGGTVLPLFEEPLPPWLAGHQHLFSILYAQNIRDEGSIPPSDIYGPNMAVRRRIFSEGYRFSEQIGPNSGQASYPMGSEAEFCARVVREAKAMAYFTPGPKVHHIVRPKQMTRDFIAGRAVRSGKGTAVLTGSAATSNRGAIFLAKQASRWLKGRSGNISAWWDFHWHNAYQAELASAADRPGK